MNSNLKTDFLNQFSDKHKDELIEFGKRITEVKADVFICMARKTACLIEVLEKFSLTRINGFFTTDRILDGNIEWLRGKSFAIVDDTLISGTTIYQINEKLDPIAKDIKVYVQCCDDDFWSRKLVKPQKPFQILKNQELLKMSSSIVKGLSVIPRPYLIDYPIIDKIKIDKESLIYFLNPDDWEISEVTSMLQEEYDILSLSYSPKDKLIEKFSEIIGCNLSRVSFFKVRLYLKRIDNYYYLTIMPIFAFNPIKSTEFNVLWDTFVQKCNFNKNTLEYFSTPTSKLRLMHYAISLKVFLMWYNDYKNKFNLYNDSLFNKERLDYLFPFYVQNELKIIQNNDLVLFHNTNLKLEFVKISYKTNNYLKKYPWNFPISLLYRLNAFFLFLYNEKELPARTAVRELGKKAFTIAKYKNLLNRLKIGFSYDHLYKSLHDVKEPFRSRFLMNFLDREIDRGIIVPINVFNKGKLYRGYRHGEEVIWAEAQDKMYILMLQEFIKRNKEKHVRLIWAEKLLVLLLKIGIGQGKLKTLHPNQFNNTNYASLIWTIYGAKVAKNIEKVYQFSPENEVTSILNSVGILKKIELPPIKTNELFEKEDSGFDVNNNLSRYAYIVINEPQVKLNKELTNFSKQIGIVFGKLANRKLSIKELVYLSSFLSEKELISALAAEINIFQKLWPSIKYKYLTNLNNIDSISLKYIKEIRKEVLFAALNNGIWKYNYFFENSPEDVINKISRRLSSDVSTQTIWDQFWPDSFSSQISSSDKKYREVIDREYLYLVIAIIFYLLIEYNILKNKYTLFSSNVINIAEVKNTINKYIENNIHLFNKYGVQISFIEDLILYIEKNDYDNFKIMIDNKSDLLTRQIKDTLKHVDSFNLRNNRDKIVYNIKNVAFIEIKNSKNDFFENLDKLIKSINFSLSTKPKYKGSIVNVYALNEYDSRFKNGFLICTYGPNSSQLLYHIFNKIYDRFYSLNEFNIILFFDLAKYQLLSRIYDENIYFGNGFYDLLYTIKSKYDLRSFNNTIFILNSNDKIKDTKKNIESYITAKRIYHPVVDEYYYSDAFYESKHFILKFEMKGKDVMNNASINNDEINNNEFQIGIITVLNIETIAVQQYLANKTPLKKLPPRKSRRNYYASSFESSDGKFEVVFTQSIKPNNISITSAYNDLVEEYHPNLIILLGKGGSINSDTKLCDVVVGTEVLYYEPQKETINGMQPRTEPIYKIDPNLLTIVNDMKLNKNNIKYISSENSTSNEFDFHTGGIGSGEVVIRYSDSKIKKTLLNFSDKVICVETEAAGFAESFYEERLKIGSKTNAVLIVRGISDKADENLVERDKYNIPCIMNSMIIIEELLKKLPSQINKFFN